MTDRSAAALAMTPRSSLAPPRADGGAPGLAPADFGERLRRRREQNELTLQQIANSTKIGIHQLRALERGDLDLLPPGFYRRAIVRQYAEAVGLNVEETSRDLASVGTAVDVALQPVEHVAQQRGD